MIENPLIRLKEGFVFILLFCLFSLHLTVSIRKVADLLDKLFGL